MDRRSESTRPLFHRELDEIQHIIDAPDGTWPEGEQFDAIMAMEMPVACSQCGRMVELDDCTFNTEFCDCPGFGACRHGLCPACCEALN